MRSGLAAILRSLVLPFGATSGRRIILDGVSGTIGVYDSAGLLRLQITTTSPELVVYDAAGNQLAAVSDTPSSGAGIFGVTIPTSSPTSLGLSVQQQGDTGMRLAVDAAGSLTFGDGTSTLGTTVGLLRSLSPLRLAVSEGLSVAEDITWEGQTYTSFAPVWRSDGTQPSAGNSSRQGRYKVFGRMVHYYGFMIRGSTATNGTGDYTFDLPLAAAEVVTTQERWPAGQAWFRDASAPADYPTGMCIINDANPDRFSIRGLQGTATSSVWSATLPVVPATSDWVGFNIIYERDSNVIGP